MLWNLPKSSFQAFFIVQFGVAVSEDIVLHQFHPSMSRNVAGFFCLENFFLTFSLYSVTFRCDVVIYK